MTAPDSASAIAHLRRLRAVRQFRPDPVPEAALSDLLGVVRWSGSAGNQQPWELVLVRDPETLRALGALEGYAAHVAGAPLGIAVVMPGQYPERETFDEGRIAERIMLAADALGLGSSIGWFRGAGRDEAKRLLGVPADRVVRTVISVGHPAEGATARGRRRKPLAEFVHEELYRAPAPGTG